MPFLKVEKFELSAFYANHNFSLMLLCTWNVNPLSRDSRFFNGKLFKYTHDSFISSHCILMCSCNF